MNRAKMLVVMAAAANAASHYDEVAKLPKDTAIPVDPFNLNAAWMEAARTPDTLFGPEAHSPIP